MKSESVFGQLMKFGCLGIIILLILSLCGCFSIFFVAVLSSSGGSFGDFSYIENTYQNGSASEKIAIIDLYGVILNYDDGVHQATIVNYMLDSLDKAITSSEIKAVIIRIDSPGGGVYDSALISDKIKEVQSTGKPVVMVVESMAASGAYWIGSGGDQIFVHEQSYVGSIGVYFQMLEYDELFKKIGIEEIYITNSEGTNKVPNNLGDENSEGHKIFKNLADQTYEDFLKEIMDGRGMSRSEILPHADGRILSARDAINVNLVDDYGDIDEAVAYIERELDLSNPSVIEFRRMELIGLSAFSAKMNVLLNGVSDPIQSRGAQAYALPAYMFENNE